MGCSMNETPKRHILGRKHVVWRIDRKNRSTFVGSARAEKWSKKFKKFKKVYLRNHNMCFFTCSPRPPTLSQRHMDLCMWAYPRPSYIFQVSSKSVKGFRSPRRSKFGLSHYFDYSLLQRLVLLYKPWCANFVATFGSLFFTCSL